MSSELDMLRRDWVGRVFDSIEVTIDEGELLQWAHACGESDPRFTDPSHPEFQAHPGFTCKLNGRRTLPEDFPAIGNGRGVDGGKGVHAHVPIRPGDVLTATSQIADAYEKTGRSGTMIFLVHRMSFTNQRGELASVVDWRMIRNTGD